MEVAELGCVGDVPGTTGFLLHAQKSFQADDVDGSPRRDVDDQRFATLVLEVERFGHEHVDRGVAVGVAVELTVLMLV